MRAIKNAHSSVVFLKDQYVFYYRVTQKDTQCISYLDIKCALTSNKVWLRFT